MTLRDARPGVRRRYPAESRVQLLQRLAGAGALDVVPLSAALDVAPTASRSMHRPSGRSTPLVADRVVVVGERRPRATPDARAPLVLAIGDAIVPRRAAHAIAEARTAAARIASASDLEAKSRQPEAVKSAR